MGNENNRQKIIKEYKKEYENYEPIILKTRHKLNFATYKHKIDKFICRE